MAKVDNKQAITLSFALQILPQSLHVIVKWKCSLMVSLGKDNNWQKAMKYVIPGNTRVISVAGIDKGYQFGILGSFSNGLVTNASWKCNDIEYPGWNSPDFDDSNWQVAVEVANHGDWPWYIIAGIASTAKWIWTVRQPDNVYCRLRL